MMSADMLLVTIFIVAMINFVRYLSSLRALIAMMRQAHPLLYQQFRGGIFSSQGGDISKQKRLYHYIRAQEYQYHHDEYFIAKCNKVRRLFILSLTLLVVFFLAIFVVAFTGL